QCNSTQLVLDNDRWMSLYWENNATTQKTLLDVVRPIELGGPEIATGIKPVKSSQNRFRVDLLPGHPRMSIIEDLLSRAWTDASSGDIGGIRRTNWLRSLIASYEGD